MMKDKTISKKAMTPVRGGSGHMFGRQQAEPAQPGVTADTDKNQTDTRGGANFAKGGTGKMFGFSGSRPVKSGQTSQ